MNLIKVPDVWNIVLSFYQNEINLREFEKRTIMDCIDELEKYGNNLFMELKEYLVGEDERQVKEDFLNCMSKVKNIRYIFNK